MALIFAFLFACGHGSADPQPNPDAAPVVPAAVEPSAVAPTAGAGGPDGAPASGVPSDPLFLGEADANGNDTVLPPATLPPATLPGATDAASLYAGCKARVEGDEKPAECKVDADCSRAGCSQEVCVPTAVAANVNTTCEKQSCFDVLESCGCTAGTCSWTVRKSL